MNIWKSPTFWRIFIVFFIPSLFFFAVLTALFIREDTSTLVGLTIFTCQALLTFGIPYVIAKRITLKQTPKPRGFDVIQIGKIDINDPE